MVKRARLSVSSSDAGDGDDDGDSNAREGIEASIHRMSTRSEARAWTSRDADEATTSREVNPFVSREAIAATRPDVLVLTTPHGLALDWAVAAYHGAELRAEALLGL